MKTVFTLLILASLVFGTTLAPAQAATGVLKVTVSDEDTGKSLPFMLYLTTDKGQGRRLPNVPFWGDHCLIDKSVDMKLPLGNYKFEIDCGPEYTTRSGFFQMIRFGDDVQNLKVKRVGRMRENRWFCADLDIHREYTEVPLALQAADLDLAPIITWNNNGYNEWADKPLPRPLISRVNQRIVYPAGARYEVPGCQVNLFNIPPSEIGSLFSGKDTVGGDTIAGNINRRVDSAGFLLDLKQKYPDLWVDGANIAMDDLPILAALGVLDSVEILDSDIGRSWISDSPKTSAASLKKPTASRDSAAQQGSDNGDSSDGKTIRDSSASTAAQKPSVALGARKTGFGRPPATEYEPKDGRKRDRQLYPTAWDLARWKQDIYFNLLNCGLRIQPSAGSGSGLSRNPVGYNRVFVRLNDEFSYGAFWEGFRQGQAVVTNGPLLATTVHGFPPGRVFQLRTDENGKPIPQPFEIGLILAVREPISYIEIIKNGKVEHTVRLDPKKPGVTSGVGSSAASRSGQAGQAGLSGQNELNSEAARSEDAGTIPPVEFNDSGWFLVRAVTDLPNTCRYAISAPYFVEFEGKPYIDRKSVVFFQRWLLERGKTIESERAAWDPKTRQEIVNSWKKARDFWLKIGS